MISYQFLFSLQSGCNAEKHFVGNVRNQTHELDAGVWYVVNESMMKFVKDFSLTNPPLFLGLNCYSMLKHVTLVLTLDAVKRIEDRILYHSHHVDIGKKIDRKSYTALDWQEQHYA